jgi:hypothetical protein
MKPYPSLEIKRSFGFIFILVSIAVGVAAILTEFAFMNNASFYHYVLIWISSFVVIFGMNFHRLKKIFPLIQNRMKNSTKWPIYVKSINGVCWAAPFIIIIILPFYTQYLILLGIGLGNLSTYIFLRKYNNQNNKEQLIVALVSLVALPISFEIGTSLFINAVYMGWLQNRYKICLKIISCGILHESVIDVILNLEIFMQTNFGMQY